MFDDELNWSEHVEHCYSHLFMLILMMMKMMKMMVLHDVACSY